MTNTAPSEQKKISPMLTVAALVTLGLAMYLSFSESWPVSYLIDFQAGSDGMYSPKLTFLITCHLARATGTLLGGRYYYQENERKK